MHCTAVEYTKQGANRKLIVAYSDSSRADHYPSKLHRLDKVAVSAADNAVHNTVRVSC